MVFEKALAAPARHRAAARAALLSTATAVTALHPPAVSAARQGRMARRTAYRPPDWLVPATPTPRHVPSRALLPVHAHIGAGAPRRSPRYRAVESFPWRIQTERGPCCIAR